MTVPVAINGTAKHFLLDLGTSPTEVSQATAAGLGLPPVSRLSEPMQLGQFHEIGSPASPGYRHEQVSVSDAKGGGGAMRTRVRIDSFTLGDATGRNLQFVIANDGDMGKSKPVDGLLSNDFFSQYDVELDFAGRQINYLTPTKCTDPDQVVFWSHTKVAAIPMTIAPDGKIDLPVTIDGHAIHAVIDTTSAQTVMRRDIAELTLGLKADTPEMMPDGARKDGRGAAVYTHTFRQIAFEGVVAINVPALIETNSMIRDSGQQNVLASRAQTADARIPDLTIGMDVLHQLHIYAVFGQKKLYMTAATPPDNAIPIRPMRARGADPLLLAHNQPSTAEPR